MSQETPSQAASRSRHPMDSPFPGSASPKCQIPRPIQHLDLLSQATSVQSTARVVLGSLILAGPWTIPPSQPAPVFLQPRQSTAPFSQAAPATSLPYAHTHHSHPPDSSQFLNSPSKSAPKSPVPVNPRIPKVSQCLGPPTKAVSGAHPNKLWDFPWHHPFNSHFLSSFGDALLHSVHHLHPMKLYPSFKT